VGGEDSAAGGGRQLLGGQGPGVRGAGMRFLKGLGAATVPPADRNSQKRVAHPERRLRAPVLAVTDV